MLDIHEIKGQISWSPACPNGLYMVEKTVIFVKTCRVNPNRGNLIPDLCYSKYRHMFDVIHKNNAETSGQCLPN